MLYNVSQQTNSRRKFINTGLQISAGAALLSLPVVTEAKQLYANEKQAYTVQQIIDIILKDITGFSLQDSVDTIKAGSKDAGVSAVVTTMFPTVGVIKKAIALKANFIIAHEPTFYNHADSLSWVSNNEVQQRKLQLLNENNITVWRAHDCVHALNPDGIIYGLVKKLNWNAYYKSGTIVSIPATSLKKIIKHCKMQLGIQQLKVIGEPDQLCSKIALLPGAWGGQVQISTIINEKPDVIIAGEISEWETAEYIRDARLMGAAISLVVLGHAVSEEPGMEWMAEWLQPKIPGIAVTHIASKNPFHFV